MGISVSEKGSVQAQHIIVIVWYESALYLHCCGLSELQWKKI